MEPTSRSHSLCESVRTCEMERAIALTGGRTTTGVVRIGNTVHRPISARAPELGDFSDSQLVAAACVLRQLHDATLDCPLRKTHEIVCHGDASPCNCVFVDGMPTAFIDFDNAHAGSRLDDLGYAAWLWIDVGNEDLSIDRQGQRSKGWPHLCPGHTPGRSQPRVAPGDRLRDPRSLHQSCLLYTSDAADEL